MRHRRGAFSASRVIAILMLAMLASLVPSPARACSCATGEPRDLLREADAAFVGTMIDHDDGLFSSAWETTFTFAVEHDLKGNLDDSVQVQAGTSESSCGIGFAEGDRVAMFLYIAGGHWTTSLCSQIDAGTLLAAAEPLPAPETSGMVRFLVGGNFGEARVLALDDRGRTLAYGWGDGDVYDLDVCPGGRRMVESVADWRVGSLVVRDVASLAVIRKVRLVHRDHPSIYEVACLDDHGRHLWAVDELKGELRVHDVHGNDDEVVFSGRGRAWGSDVQDGFVYLVVQRVFGRVDPEVGAFEAIMKLPASTSNPRLSPDGRWVAAIRYGGARAGEPPSDILLMPVDGGPPISEPLVFWNDGGSLEWLDDERLLFYPAGEDVERIAVYAVPSMDEVVGADGWQTREQVREGDTVFGLGWQGLVTVRLGSDEETRMIHKLPSEVYALDLVPGELEAEPSPPPANVTDTVAAPPAPPPRPNGPPIVPGLMAIVVGVATAIVVWRRRAALASR